MDDFGTGYQTEDWELYDTQYGFSAATFGWLDEEALMICITFCIDYAAQEV